MYNSIDHPQLFTHLSCDMDIVEPMVEQIKVILLTMSMLPSGNRAVLDTLVNLLANVTIDLRVPYDHPVRALERCIAHFDHLAHPDSETLS